MLNSILKRFGFELLKLSDITDVRETVAAFALEMEAELQAGEFFDGEENDSIYDAVNRFNLFESLTGRMDTLVDMVYADPYGNQAEDIRDQCSAVGVSAMNISLKYGELLPRPERG